MNLCPHCGVELEAEEYACPLCRRPLPERPADGWPAPAPSPPAPVAAAPVPPPATAGPAALSPATRRRAHRLLLEIYSLLAATAAIVLLAIDLASGMSVTWARYPLVSLVFLWLVGFVPILCSGRSWVLLSALTVAVGLYLFALDGLTPGRDWFLPLALPLILLAGAVLALTLGVVRIGRLSLFSTIAVALLAASVLAVGLDLLLNRFFAGRLFVGWSVIALACTLPPVLILFYLRKRLRARQAEIRKVLHF